MTFRAKPVVKRTHRPQWESQDRRNFYMNLGFGLVVAAALLILALAVALSWYNEHLAPVGSVNGEQITKDQLRERVGVEVFRLDEASRRIATQVASGRLSEAEAAAQEQLIGQQRQQITLIALERLIDNRLQASLAVGEGVVVTDADIDARLVEEATTPAARRAWLIEVAPARDDGAATSTPAQIAAAKAKAETALTDLKAGKAWEDVAKTTSTHTATAAQGGDLGWIEDSDATLDEGFVKAVFEAALDTPTAVLEGEDGVFRIGRVTDIQEVRVDPLFQTKVENDGIALDAYRRVVSGDVIRRKLEDKIVADLVKPGPQRKVAEIYIADSGTVAEGDIKVRHILYSPKDDPQGAATVPADDPAWATAEADAKAAYDRLKGNVALFDSIARAESDEGSARGATGSGGKLPYFGPGSGVDAAFLAAISKPELKPGDLLEPIRSQFGWHVIQVMYRPPDSEMMTELKTRADGGAEFAALARDFSEADTAAIGGDLGWITRGQLPDELITAIFSTSIGKTSEIVRIPNDGLYLFKVTAEEMRTPEGKQLERLRQTAFADWYTEKKGAAAITRDPGITSSLGL
jgi:parvulin-like peptidyl-prolyl isomerase